MSYRAFAVCLTVFLTGLSGTPAESAPAQPNVDKLEVGQAVPRAALLKAGVHRYVRYMISGDSRIVIDLWTRILSYEGTDGHRIMRIRQRWDAADKSYVALFDQTFEPGT